jgi:hypothetical protein
MDGFLSLMDGCVGVFSQDMLAYVTTNNERTFPTSVFPVNIKKRVCGGRLSGGWH